MIVEKSSEGVDEAWLVHPCPGYLLKFKHVHLGSNLFSENEDYKLFLNVCHCEELPAPLEDLEEDQVAGILDSDDPSRYKIPICVGDLECVRDNKDENAAKIDVVVNSTFFKKRLENSEFFRQLFLLVSSEAIKNKHGIKLDSKDAVRLKNRKVIGEVSAQRIRKRPEKSVIEEIENKEDGEAVKTPGHDEPVKPKNCLLMLRRGKDLEIKMKLPSDFSSDVKRIHVKMNDDHLLVHDSRQTVVDIYVPLKMAFKDAKATLSLRKRILKVFVSVTF